MEIASLVDGRSNVPPNPYGRCINNKQQKTHKHISRRTNTLSHTHTEIETNKRMIIHHQNVN